MTGSITNLWICELRALDRCPWPGPRPVTASEATTALVGREADASSFRQVVHKNKLIVLDGDSGVGKTSLLQGALIPTLEQAGYTVALCRNWTVDMKPGAALAFLATAVRNALVAKRDDPAIAELLDNAREGVPFLADLEKARPKTAVIVLDQFEELIRSSDEHAEAIIDIILALNRRMELKIVVSLRSEYLFHLRRLDEEAQPYSYRKFTLEQIDDEAAATLITKPNGDEPGRYITDGAAERLTAAWFARKDEDREDRGRTLQGGIGLLHLQSLMYSLNARAAIRAGAGAAIDIVDVEALERAAMADRRYARVEALYAEGMASAVETKLARCEDAARRSGVDPYLIHAAKGLVARSANHLSSDGYKLHREVADLAEQAAGAELESLRSVIARAAGPGDDPDNGPGLQLLETQATLLRRLVAPIESQLGALVSDDDVQAPDVDLLGASWRDIAGLLDDLPSDAFDVRTLFDGDPMTGLSDVDAVTCGPMMGMPPASVFVEEVRRFAVAISWMAHSSLVRLSSPTPTRVVAALVHDRLGEGLNEWARSVQDSPNPQLHAITAPKGASYYWKLHDGTFRTELDGSDGGWVLGNLRWRGGWVSADFRQIIFANCDFRGTMFQNCRFVGVDFVNCLLDGVMFDNCTVEGSAEPARGKWTDTPSRFVIDTAGDSDTHLNAALLRYRGVGTHQTKLYSPSAGMPVLPADLRDVLGDTAVDVVGSTPSTGGLTIYGGRISTLVVRNCRFDDGTLSLRYVAGSGFDVVEQTDSGSFEIFASALRHVTFSPPVVRASQPGKLAIRFKGSALAQVWLSDGLNASVTFDDCKIVQVWNASPGTHASVVESTYYDVVGCTVQSSTHLAQRAPRDPSSPVMEFAHTDELDPLSFVSMSTEEMEYRSDPTNRFFDDVVISRRPRQTHTG